MLKALGKLLKIGGEPDMIAATQRGTCSSVVVSV